MKRFIPLAVVAAISTTAHADRMPVPADAPPAFKAECGGCHLPFPPALLPAEDWQTIMADLEHHFGANAGLDEKPRREIAGFLERNASPHRVWGSRAEAPRITTSDWFVRKHQSAIRLWRKGRIKSLADCAACHKGPDIERMMAE